MTQGLMLFINNFVLVVLGDWTMQIANKFLIINLTIIDENLIRWFPFIVGLTCALTNVKDLQVLVERVFWTLLTVIGFLLLAILVALFTWSSNGADSPLLPEYIKYQPFMNYWTVFIALGITLPMIQLIWKRKKNAEVNDEFDN